jgi:hypothetical protein
VRCPALALAMLVVPTAAEACASCISSPFGDQTYNWPYLVLILVPFAAAAVIGGVMMRVTGARFSDLRPWLTRVLHPAAQEETK